MIKRVLITTIVLTLIALFLFWLFTGGPAAAGRTARTLANPIDLIFGTSTGGSFIRLPWQAASTTRGPDISDYAAQADAYNRASGNTDQQSSPSDNGSTVRTFGNPSPFAGRVRITDSAATESDPAAEFIEISASENNTAPISLANWSLQSAVSGARFPIPEAAPVFVMGVVNNVQPVRLEPGASAFLSTAASPTGTSFRENICTGYLNELQKFTPELASECPTPADALPLNAENVRTYGSSCIDYVGSLTACHFPGNLPSNLSPACRSYIINNYSYNGCVNAYLNEHIDLLGQRPSFALPTWRLYFALRSEAWDNSHDIIRLLDGQGQTVDVLTY